MLLLVLLVSNCLTCHVKARPAPSSSLTTATNACKATLYPGACESLLLSTSQVADGPKTVGEIFDLSVHAAIQGFKSTRSLAYDLSLSAQKLSSSSSSSSSSGGGGGSVGHESYLPSTAMDDCVELLDHSLGQLTKILDTKTRPTLSGDDVRTWLSAALTHHTTCLEGLDEQARKFPKERDMVHQSAQTMDHHISNSLALHKLDHDHDAVEEKEKSSYSSNHHDYPGWMSRKDRKLLEASVEDLEVKAVVAKDGRGTHKTIGEALEFVSTLAGGGRNVIHVTAGTYSESSLKISRSSPNIMLVGDGKGNTVITGSKSAGGGSTTFGSASFGVSGDGFMARDISFENNAGPAKHQAVALLVSSDKSVFYRCSIVGYQDTLYTLSNRQFYRETDIYGTVDFIFAHVRPKELHNRPRSIRPESKHRNLDPRLPGCRHSDLASAKNPTYLGRPWKQHSRTVYLESFLDGSISSAGWYPWAGGGSPSSVFYGEYMNSGPGSGTSGRVHWPGYHAALSTAEATEFTVARLISGTQWLPSTGVGFDSGLHP
ncbi:hypothetical protein Syun_026679 [Stephania yunnanensis]|uniref:Pectinesterase inhibitor domain-containing protein n=1 Tax=Stephania yunnanensis TaxID=152371 RepID=A0AAP0EUF1_9MAGN